VPPSTFSASNLSPSDYVVDLVHPDLGLRYSKLVDLSHRFKDAVALPLAHCVRRAHDRPEGKGSASILPTEIHVKIVKMLNEKGAINIAKTSRYWRDVCKTAH
jgi:hypothetical protein